MRRGGWRGVVSGSKKLAGGTLGMSRPYPNGGTVEVWYEIDVGALLLRISDGRGGRHMPGE